MRPVLCFHCDGRTCGDGCPPHRRISREQHEERMRLWAGITSPGETSQDATGSTISSPIPPVTPTQDPAANGQGEATNDA
jgi:hypothetical protein